MEEFNKISKYNQMEKYRMRIFDLEIVHVKRNFQL